MQNSLKIASLLMVEMKVLKKNCNRSMTEELFATSKVYELVKKGIPFREAYKKIASSIYPSGKT